MRLRDVALANLQVRRMKTFFLFLGITLALGSVVALVTLTSSLQAQLDRSLAQMGIRFLISPPVEDISYTYNGMVIGDVSPKTQPTLPPDALERVKNLDLPELTGYSPKLVVAAQLRGQDVLLCGLDFPQELALRNWWEVQEGQLPQSPGEILLGAEAARQTGLQVGDTLSLWGEDFRVAGILKKGGEPEDRLIFLDLAKLQSLWGKKALSFIELRFRLNDQDPEEASARYTKILQEEFPQMSVTMVKDENLLRQEVIKQFSRFAALAAAVVFSLGWLMVVLTMMSSVSERVKEIGVLRAIGYRKGHIIQIIFWEAGIISGFGGLAGYLLGLGAGKMILPLVSGASGILVWHPLHLPLVVVLALLVGFSASLYPAYRAARLDPVEAFSRL